MKAVVAKTACSTPFRPPPAVAGKRDQANDPPPLGRGRGTRRRWLMSFGWWRWMRSWRGVDQGRRAREPQ